MSSIPTGNVTFLFTDIEGSTKLAQKSHEIIEETLQKHHSILNEVIESNNGFVFKTIGDAYCCAFENSTDAVKTAVEVQIRLNSEKWNYVVIKIRIGIHSGPAEWKGTDYMGYLTLARVQRLMSAGNGGQILISNDVYEIVKDNLKNEISFRDLGERRLKDLTQPMRLYQITSPKLPSDFPPLKTLDARPNNLPVQLTSFIGREAEMQRVKDLLSQTHLLTLTGSGGAGKTRLSLQVAADVIDDFANGVWFVELASFVEPSLLPQAIMKIFGVKEEPKRSLEDTLCDYLKDKEILIIMDNCEHLIKASAKLTEKLLISSPKLKIIATSREALRCEGEYTHNISSLDVPNPKEELSPEKFSKYEAVRLFTERALAVDSKFRINKDNARALAQICIQLDGIPLAIELAAASIKALSVEKIHERLSNRFNLLTGGKRTALPRQQTLRALIDWSYDLLYEEEKILWRRLSVFAGGWTLEAAEEVCSDERIKKEEVLELLIQLTWKSIIIFDREKERYRILETLKQYGEDKLREANETEEMLSKHLHYFVEISETAESKLKGSEMHVWVEKLEADHSNLQSAIEWSIRDGDKEEGARLAGALGYFWNIRGYYSTGSRLLRSILDNAIEVSRISRAKLLNSLGSIDMYLGEYERAQKFLKESLSLRREMKDKSGIADSLNSLGNLSYTQGNFEPAQKLIEESLTLRREMEDKGGIAASLTSLGNIAYTQGDYEQAQKFDEESLALRREIGEKRGIASSLNCLGITAFSQGNYEQAKKFYEESLALRREMGDKPGLATSLDHLGILAKDQGNYEKAKQLYMESLALSREIGERRGIAFSLNNLGVLEKELGNHEQAQKFYEESLSLTRELGEKRGIAYSLNSLGIIAKDQGKYKQAQKFFEESLVLSREVGEKRGIAYSLNNLGNVEYNQGNYDQAQKFFEESMSLSREMRDKSGIADSLNSLGNVSYKQGQYEPAKQFYEESLTLKREIGEKSGIAESLNSLGNFARNHGNYNQARKFYEESLNLRLETGFKDEISNNLLGFAGIFVAADKLTMAVTLLGSVEAALKSMGTILDRDGQTHQEQITGKVKENLSDEDFSKYFEEGKKLTLEEAAKLALSDAQ